MGKPLGYPVSHDNHPRADGHGMALLVAKKALIPWLLSVRWLVGKNNVKNIIFQN
jgi:hypothetical protein